MYNINHNNNIFSF